MTVRQSLRLPHLPVITWVGIGLTLFLLLLGASSGVGGVLLMAGLIGFFTAVYALVTGRRSWALIPSRKTAAAVLAGAVVVFVVSVSVSPAPADADLAGSAASASSSPTPTATRTPTPTPTPTAPAFTEESPVDPNQSTPAEDAATIVLADSSATDTTAVALLATLPMKGRAPQTGYDRTGSFGTAWLDVDQNGCDTRNDILARDLTTIVKSGECRVMTGTLVGPYTGKTITFVRGQGTSSLVQIDHVVALSNAWQTGGQQLSQAQRVSLANDPLNLLAVDGRTNSSKGAGDTATWLPPQNTFRCAYVARQISVKATYGLWVTAPEHAAMTRILAGCPDERAVTSGFAPAPIVVVPEPVAVAPEPVAVAPAPVAVAPVPVAPAPVAPAPVAPAPVAPAPEAYYKNCDAARAAGGAPVHVGQAGYGRHLDRDGDGVGCE